MFFFFNDTATTEIYTLSLHDALPIYSSTPSALLNAYRPQFAVRRRCRVKQRPRHPLPHSWSSVCSGISRSGEIPFLRSEEHTSELQSQSISYAVFCLKNKTKPIMSIS